MAGRKLSRAEQLARAEAFRKELAARGDGPPNVDDLIARKTGTILLVTMGVALAGTLLFRGQPMQRNMYASQSDCERDYARERCEPGGNYNGTYANWRYYGPWYPEDPAKRAPGDAGTNEGRRSSLANSGGYTGVEYGTRGGFGSSGRVRAIGS